MTNETLLRAAPHADAAPARSAAAGAPRFDLYGPIHKALRLLYGDTLARLGSADAGDAASLDGALAQADALFELLHAHYDHEDRFMHPALERAQPGCCTRVAGEHARHLQALDALRERVAAVRASAGAPRAAALARLYRALALQMAADLEHMEFEDGELNGVLWRHYDDAALLALHDELVAAIEPATMMLALRWMIPALDAGERAAVLGGMQQGMPREAFAAVVGIARETLSEPEWRKLAGALGLAGAGAR